MVICGLSKHDDDFKLVRDVRNSVFHVKDGARRPEHLLTPEIVFRRVQALNKVRKEIAKRPSS